MRRLTLLFLLTSFIAQAQQKINWPNHKKAVIVLTYDDALDSQLDNAVPLLDSLHFKGTFFVTGAINAATIPRWRAVAAKGHELANHTIYHPCLSTTDEQNPFNYAERYTVYGIIREIYTMNSFLFAVDNKVSRTYAYPCTETMVGGVSYVDSLRKSGLVKYARIGGDNDAVITDFKKLDPMLVPSYGLEDNSTGEQLIAFVKKVEQTGGMGIFMFHGIGGDYINTPVASHKELLQYLEKKKNDIWVTTFQEAMDYVTGTEKGM